MGFLEHCQSSGWGVEAGLRTYLCTVLQCKHNSINLAIVVERLAIVVVVEPARTLKITEREMKAENWKRQADDEDDVD